jgi:hypothetical protein
VETKGGSADPEKGTEQVRGAIREFRSTFSPPQPHSDSLLIHAEFGRVVNELANRLAHYQALGPEEQVILHGWKQHLLEGRFKLAFLRDGSGALGEVIHVRHDTGTCEYRVSNKVRILEVPAKCIELLESNDLVNVLKDFPVAVPRVYVLDDFVVVSQETEEESP